MSGKEYEMRPIGGSQAQHNQNADRVRTSSVIAADFQYLRQTMNNQTAADQSRKTSRLSKGLNPDTSRAPKQPQCNPCLT